MSGSAGSGSLRWVFLSVPWTLVSSGSDSGRSLWRTLSHRQCRSEGLLAVGLAPDEGLPAVGLAPDSVTLTCCISVGVGVAAIGFCHDDYLRWW